MVSSRRKAGAREPEPRKVITVVQAHPALFIPELVLEYFEYLYDPEGYSGKSIEWASRVCKSWREPGLTVRWRLAWLEELIDLLGTPCQDTGDLMASPVVNAILTIAK